MILYQYVFQTISLFFIPLPSIQKAFYTSQRIHLSCTAVCTLQSMRHGFALLMMFWIVHKIKQRLVMFINKNGTEQAGKEQAIAEAALMAQKTNTLLLALRSFPYRQIVAWRIYSGEMIRILFKSRAGARLNLMYLLPQISICLQHSASKYAAYRKENETV